MPDGLVIEDRGPVRWIALDRPDCKNGLTPALAQSITSALRDARDARAIAITGRNGAFCSGLDLRVAMESGPELLDKADEHLALFQGLTRAIVNAPQPTVAIVDGPAVGFGCDLALACDVRVASTRAYFQESFARIGLIPDGGGTWMLPRLVGLSKALEMAMLAEKLDAKTAYALGLLARLVEPEQLEAEARAVVEKLAASAPLSMQRIKRLMRDGLARDFAAGMQAEGAAQIECLRSEDCIEGIQAFFMKRPPEFKGR
jgi:enoyl-CoA hydratase/carnithine racemase